MPSEFGDKCCPICGKNEELRACSGCGLIYYCSVEHQKSHWKVHKGNCKAYKVCSRFVFLKLGHKNFTKNILDFH